MIIGAKDEDITKKLTEEKWGGIISTWIIIIVVIIAIVGFVEISEDKKNNPISEDGQIKENNKENSNFWDRTKDVIRNKQVLGTLLFFMICYFLIRNITGTIEKK